MKHTAQFQTNVFILQTTQKKLKQNVTYQTNIDSLLPCNKFFMFQQPKQKHFLHN